MRRRLLGSTLSLLLLAGCDLGPEGPGTLSGRVAGDDVGAVLLEVEGSGILGFSARGAARVYSAPVPGRPGVHRVIVITPEPGLMDFDVEVEDLAMDRPVVRVVSASSGHNRPFPVSRVGVRIFR